MLALLTLACEAPARCDGAHGESGRSLPTSPPLAEVDVLVVGSGAGGLGAAWAAREAGASVQVVERAAEVGGASVYAGSYWATGTRWQAEGGVTDSPAAAAAEWAAITGGDAADPSVAAFLEGSAGVLDWLAELGVSFTLQGYVPADSGSVARMHPFSYEVLHPVDAVEAALGDAFLFETTAMSLVLDGPRVAGAWVEGAAGEAAWIRARAVVVATGGFARNDALVLHAVPALTEAPTWYEAFPGMDGNGLPLMVAAGGTLQNLASLALFSHAVVDPQVGVPEVMVVVGLDSAVVVDPRGVRVDDERQFGSVSMGTRYLAEGPFYALSDADVWAQTTFDGRGFNYFEAPDALHLTADAYAALHDVPTAETIGELAMLLGMEPAALEETVDTYNEAARDGVDPRFGKPAQNLLPLVTPPFRALPLVLGRAKSFGGAATDVTGAVLDPRGAPIPGLYAAGEASGFLGTEAVGRGFNGSITAAWWSGLRAGAAAAAGVQADP
jgi:succinate dehydrogenase/fumarate reductase flavoprotein subunit